MYCARGVDTARLSLVTDTASMTKNYKYIKKKTNKPRSDPTGFENVGKSYTTGRKETVDGRRVRTQWAWTRIAMPLEKRTRRGAENENRTISRRTDTAVPALGIATS